MIKNNMSRFNWALKRLIKVSKKSSTGWVSIQDTELESDAKANDWYERHRWFSHSDKRAIHLLRWIAEGKLLVRLVGNSKLEFKSAK